MKQLIIKNILIICMIANLMSSSAHAAVGDWVARKKQQSRAYVLNKIQEAERKTQELLAALRANTNCLVRGTCPAAKRKQMRAIAGAITVAIAAIIAVAVTARGGEDEKAVSPASGFVPGFVAAPNIEEIARQNGVTYEVNDKEQNMFLSAVKFGQWKDAKQYISLVKKNVLDAGLEFAKEMYAHFQRIGDVSKSRPYALVAAELRLAVDRFNSALQQANEYLLNAVRRGDQQSVQQAVCGSPEPSRNAIAVALEILEDRARKYAPDVRSEVNEIINFLKKPRCGHGG